MKTLLLILIIPIMLFGQTLRPNSVMGWHLNTTAKDTIRTFINDSLAVDRTWTKSIISDSLWYAFDKANIRNVLSPKYGAKGDDSTDDYAAIQAALDAGGRILIPYTGHRYIIGDSLVISSNTYLKIEPGVEIYAKNGMNEYMIMNKATQTMMDSYGGVPNPAIPADSNIVIDGGIWNGNKSGNTGNGSFPDWVGHVMWFDNIKKLTIKNTYNYGAIKWAIFISHFETVRCYNNGFNSDKDAFHFSVGKDLIVRDTWGHSKDDMLSFTIGDYSTNFQADDGDIENVTIDNVHSWDIDGTNGYGAYNIIKFAGSGQGNAYKYKDFRIKNLHGIVSEYGIIASSNDALMSSDSIYFENLKIENIDIISNNDLALIYLGSSSTDILNIKNITIREGNSGIWLGNTAGTYNENIDNVTIDKLFCDDDSSRTIITTNANIEKLYLSHIYVDRPLLSISSGSLLKLFASDLNVEDHNIISTKTSTNVEKIQFNSCYFEGYDNPMQFKNGCTVILNDITFDSVLTKVFTVEGGDTFRIIGDNINYIDCSPQIGFNPADGTVLSVNNPDLHTNAYQLDSQVGDEFYNLSATGDWPVNCIVKYTSDSVFVRRDNSYIDFTQSVDVPSIAANSYATYSITVSYDILGTDFILIEPNNSLPKYFTWSHYIDASTNQINFVFHNNDASSHDPAASNWRFRIIRK